LSEVEVDDLVVGKGKEEEGKSIEEGGERTLAVSIRSKKLI
jgi:hypothetical protein